MELHRQPYGKSNANAPHDVHLDNCKHLNICSSLPLKGENLLNYPVSPIFLVFHYFVEHGFLANHPRRFVTYPQALVASGYQRNNTNDLKLVLWAQRSSSTTAEKNLIFLTISAPDVPKIDLDLKPTSLTFSGHSETKKTTYHVELEFYSDIDVENSKTSHTSKNVEFVLRKKESKDEYWPRLLKESKKVHFLKTDFDKVRL